MDCNKFSAFTEPLPAAEYEMLADVETIAQKAEALKEFADTKYVKKPSSESFKCAMLFSFLV